MPLTEHPSGFCIPAAGQLSRLARHWAVLMAALFEPFPLWLAAWEHHSLEAIPLVSVHKGRIVHASQSS